MKILDESFPDFAGKYISIIKKDSDSSSVEMEDPLFENLGGRLFITGIAPKGTSKNLGWLGGIKVSIAWDHVQEYYLFDDEVTFTKAINIKTSQDVKRLYHG